MEIYKRTHILRIKLYSNTKTIQKRQRDKQTNKTSKQTDTNLEDW